MSSGKAIPLHLVFQAALQAQALLAGACSRIQIAGSIRRQKDMVKDIEIVCAPLSEIALYRRCDELLRLGLFQKRKNSRGHTIAWGNRFRAVWFKPNLSESVELANGFIPLDLFIVLPDRQWGPTMLIRTGPGDANQALVTAEWMKNSNGDQGVLPPGMKFQDGAILRGGVELDTPEEWDVFSALGLPYISPLDRSVEMYQRWARRRQWRKPGHSFVPNLYQELLWETKPVQLSSDIEEYEQETLFA